MLPLSSSPAKIPSTTNFLSWRREIKIEEREREKNTRGALTKVHTRCTSTRVALGRVYESFSTPFRPDSMGSRVALMATPRSVRHCLLLPCTRVRDFLENRMEIVYVWIHSDSNFAVSNPKWFECIDIENSFSNV